MDFRVGDLVYEVCFAKLEMDPEDKNQGRWCGFTKTENRVHKITKEDLINSRKHKFIPIPATSENLKTLLGFVPDETYGELYLVRNNDSPSWCLWIDKNDIAWYQEFLGDDNYMTSSLPIQYINEVQDILRMKSV